MKTTKKLNDGKIKLTKKNIADGYIREFINKAQGGDKVLSDKELFQERNKIIPSSIENVNLYVFAYGSLLWNPTIDFEEQVFGKIYGYHRSFCMLTKLGRGSYKNPGLMLGLDKGGSCKGLLFKLKKKNDIENIDILFKREMVTKAYIPKLLSAYLNDGKQVKALAFTVDKNHKNYFKEKSYVKKIELILKANGFLGSCKEYLKNPSNSLRELGICDKEITNLMKVLTTE